MDFDAIKKGIDNFRDIAIDNVDYHINDYFADDLINAGMVDYLIDDYGIYFYWIEKAKDLSDFMNILINYFHEKEPEKKNEEDLRKIYNNLIECVGIKRVIDKILIASSHYNENEVKEWMCLEVEKEKNSNFIHLIGNDSIKKTIISELHKLLKSKGYINIEYRDFEHHFRPVSGNLFKIQWLGTEIQIAALIHLMIENGIIPRTFQYKKSLLSD
ncbi:MAG: hypothetical protein ACTSXN_08385 [Promethearchaeota archaeon]